MDLKKIYKEFNSLSNDFEKWRWVKTHQETGIIIKLDNDDTYGIIPGEDDLLFQFETYLGRDAGIFELLASMNIKCECV